MALLFDQPLDDFPMDDDFFGFSNVGQNFWDAEEEKFNLGSALPTPPLSPDQQLQLKQEAEALESWANDAEVECYLSYNQDEILSNENQNINLSYNQNNNVSHNNNFVLNDRIWCDEKILTPTELLADSFIKQKTPTLDDIVSQSSHIRPITPSSTVIRDVHCSTPLRVDESPMKKHPLLQKRPAKLDLSNLSEVMIKEEPESPTYAPLQNLFSPPPLKMSTESSFTTAPIIRIKEEPEDRTPPRPEFQIRIPRIKEESSHSDKSKFVNEMRLAVSAATERSARRSSRFTDMIAPQADKPLSKLREPLPKTKRVIKKEKRPVQRSSDSFLGEETSEVYTKRRLSESSAGEELLSPKRRRDSARPVKKEVKKEEEDETKPRMCPDNHCMLPDRPKRYVQTQMERRRRMDLKDCYRKLHTEVPSISHSDRVPKIVILKKSSEYVQEIESEEQANRDELRQLRLHQKHLVEKFRQLFKLTQPSSSNH